jgi:excisionase family DNA binding protein
MSKVVAISEQRGAMSASGAASEPVTLLLRTTEASRLLSISRSVLYQLMDSGEIRYVKIGRSRRVPYSELRRRVEMVKAED